MNKKYKNKINIFKKRTIIRRRRVSTRYLPIYGDNKTYTRKIKTNNVWRKPGSVRSYRYTYRYTYIIILLIPL